MNTFSVTLKDLIKGIQVMTPKERKQILVSIIDQFIEDNYEVEIHDDGEVMITRYEEL